MSRQCLWSYLLLLCGTPVFGDAPNVVENSLGMRFVLVPAGSFVMGTADIDEARMGIPEAKPDDVLDETPAHRVTIAQPFYLGETEMTQAVWFKVMENKPGPEDFWNRPDWERLPMAAASWFMAQRFVEEASEEEVVLDRLRLDER